MPAALIPLAIGAAASIGGGLAGNAIAGAGRDKANAIQQQVLDAIKNLPTPELQMAAFQQYKSAGTLTPELQRIVQQSPSEMNGVMGKIDPRLMQSQMAALGKLSQLGNGGLQPQDLAALSQIQRSSDQDAQAKSQQILQDSQQRGEGGSGANLAAQLMNAQQGANRMAGENMGVGSNVSQAALNAIMQAGQLGGQIQGQQFGENSQVAAAQDAINRFNAQNQQSIVGQNTNARNYGQQYNLQNLQNIMNQNTGLANQQFMYNNDITQRNYQNQLQKLQGVTGQQNNMANTAERQGTAQGEVFSKMGQGIASAAGVAAGALGGGGGGAAPSALQGFGGFDFNGDNTKNFKMPGAG